jgi:hypothetical protein
MRIYIDEGGTFQVPAGRDYLLSLVAALVVPATGQSSLFYEFMHLRDHWGIATTEIKGRELDEARFADVIKLLTAHDVLLEFLAIDMAWHTERQLTEFKQHQARALLDSITPQHQPTLIAQMKELIEILADTPNQLFVQAFLTLELIDRVVQTATLYYSQRVPEELGHFDWVVDRKDRELTKMERLWTTLIVPVGQNRALNAPFITLKGGNYAHFDRFRLAGTEGARASDVKWLEQNITFPRRVGSRIIDMKKVLQESFRFADSREELGLQLADIVASACRRAFNGHLQQKGWEGLGRLLIKKDGKPPILGLATPPQAASRDQLLHEAPSRVWLALDAAARSMWV